MKRWSRFDPAKAIGDSTGGIVYHKPDESWVATHGMGTERSIVTPIEIHALLDQSAQSFSLRVAGQNPLSLPEEARDGVVL